MAEQKNILISVRGIHIDNMLSGSKTVELRRRAPRIRSRTRIWIYDKSPTASVRALGILDDIETLPPEELWIKHHAGIGLTKNEFDQYVCSRKTASALILDHVHELRRPISLSSLREVWNDFHPPQFYMNLNMTSPIYQRLIQEVLCSCEGCIAK
jgi:predicted transcriptional regulator